MDVSFIECVTGDGFNRLGPALRTLHPVAKRNLITRAHDVEDEVMVRVKRYPQVAVVNARTKQHFVRVRPPVRRVNAEHVLAVTLVEHERIRATPTFDIVVACATSQDIVSVTTEDAIVACTAVCKIIAGSTAQEVIAVTAVDPVIPILAFDFVVPAHP